MDREAVACARHETEGQMRTYTHFVDAHDGNGHYRDYKKLGTALTRHSQAVRDANTARSWIREYDSDDREYARTLADWPA